MASSASLRNRRNISCIYLIYEITGCFLVELLLVKLVKLSISEEVTKNSAKDVGSERASDNTGFKLFLFKSGGVGLGLVGGLSEHSAVEHLVPGARRRVFVILRLG